MTGIITGYHHVYVCEAIRTGVCRRCGEFVVVHESYLRYRSIAVLGCIGLLSGAKNK